MEKPTVHSYYLPLINLSSGTENYLWLIKICPANEDNQRCTLRSEIIFGNWKPFKNDKKCSLFHLKSSFCSQDIGVFFLSLLFGRVAKRLD